MERENRRRSRQKWQRALLALFIIALMVASFYLVGNPPDPQGNKTEYRSNSWSQSLFITEEMERLLPHQQPRGRELEDELTRSRLAIHRFIEEIGYLNITRGGKKVYLLMEALSSNTKWMEELLYQGPMPENAEVFLKALAELYSPELQRNAPLRRLATAIAMEVAELTQDEVASPEERQKLARERYDVYSEALLQKQLNANFKSLSLWEMRLLMANCLNKPWGEAKTLRWARQNLRLPAQEYIFIGSRLRPRNTDYFGLSLGENRDFYMVYDNFYHGGRHELHTRLNMADLPARRNYAVMAASANGVLALNCPPAKGEDHLGTFMVHTGLNWRAEEPDKLATSVCRTPWGRNKSTAFIELAQQLYHHDALTTQTAERMLAWAKLQAKRGLTNEAWVACMEALNIQPLLYHGLAYAMTLTQDEDEKDELVEVFRPLYARWPQIQASLPELKKGNEPEAFILQ